MRDTNRGRSRSETNRRLREQQLLEMSHRFRRVFGTDEGKVVLNQILHGICGYNLPTMGFDRTEMQVFTAAVRKDVANEILGLMRGSIQDENGKSVLPVGDMDDEDVDEREMMDG